MPVVGLFAPPVKVTVPEPLIFDHVPIPVLGVFPARVVVRTLHRS